MVVEKMGSVMRGGINLASSDWQKPGGCVHQRGMHACVCVSACVKEVPREKKGGRCGREGGSVRRLVYSNCKPPQTSFIPPVLLYILTSHYHHQQSSCATDDCSRPASSSPSLCPAPNRFFFHLKTSFLLPLIHHMCRVGPVQCSLSRFIMMDLSLRYNFSPTWCVCHRA